MYRTNQSWCTAVIGCLVLSSWLSLFLHSSRFAFFSPKTSISWSCAPVHLSYYCWHISTTIAFAARQTLPSSALNFPSTFPFFLLSCPVVALFFFFFFLFFSVSCCRHTRILCTRVCLLLCWKSAVLSVVCFFCVSFVQADSRGGLLGGLYRPLLRFAGEWRLFNTHTHKKYQHALTGAAAVRCAAFFFVS